VLAEGRRTFVDPHRMLSAARQEPPVRKKLALLMRTYEALDPRMGEVFKGLGLFGLGESP
jgi:hypothetical protein